MDALRRRLDELAARPRSPGLPMRPLAADSPIAPAAILPAAPTPPAPPRPLADILGGREHLTPAGGCWCVETTFEAACVRQGLPLPACLVASGASASLGESTATAACGEPTSSAATDPVDCRGLIIDIETGGFAGSPVFLIGLVDLAQSPLRVVQLLARDYPEEHAILAAFADLATRAPAWVSFNGRSFDAPLLADRALRCRVPLPAPPTHVDLLHASRRRWKGAFANCRLQTLERHLLGWRRIGDVPGAYIPDLFHHFLRTGCAAPLRPVLEHNQLDLIACAALLRLLRAGE